MKTCSQCKVEKPVEACSRRAAAKDGRQPQCKECAHKMMVRWYQANKARHRAGVAARFQRNRDAFRTFVAGLSCIDCGEADPVVLEFDHVRGEKTSEIGTMLRNGWALRRIMAETEKCEVRCANCHRRRTYPEKVAFYRALREGA